MSDGAPSSAPRRFWLLAALAVWLGYGAYRVLHAVVQVAVVGAGALPLGARVVLSLVDALLLAAAVPLAVALTARFPVRRPHRVRHVVLHLAVGLVFSALLLFALQQLGGRLTGGAARVERFAEFYLQSVHSILFVYLGIVAVAHAADHHFRARRRETEAAQLEAQLAAARLETLRTQLHPHFLFNALNVISELVHRDPAAADAMIGRLGSLLRAALDATRLPTVSLRDELEVLRTYVEIQQLRFGAQLRVTVEAEPAALAASVPPLLLQPLVENAIRHGVGPLGAPGCVAVRACVHQPWLVVEVRDSGVGLPARPREGVGLRNTRSRLQALYGERQSLALAAAEGGGTVATVRVPFGTADVTASPAPPAPSPAPPADPRRSPPAPPAPRPRAARS